MTKKYALIQRWSDSKKKEMSRCLRNKNVDCSSLFGSVDGKYVDVRGCKIDFILKGISISDYDFTFSSFEKGGQLLSCNVDGSRFISADISDGNFTGTYTNCDFYKANLSRTDIIGRFTDCDFSSANLSRSKFDGAAFVRCSFLDAKIEKVNFYNSRFVDCDFFGACLKDYNLANGIFENCISGPI